MTMQVLQNDSSLEHQLQLVAATLPELESFIIIGKRPTDSGKMANFASCSFSEYDLANAVADFLIGHPQAIMPFVIGAQRAYNYIAANEKTD